MAKIDHPLNLLRKGLSIIKKTLETHFSTPDEDIQSLDFEIGEITYPSLEGSLKDIDITYPIEPPFQYVNIKYEEGEGALVERVKEPLLSEGELRYLRIIEKAFEKLISTKVGIIAGEDREEYLRERFFAIINVYGLKLTEPQKERMFYHLKKRYIGYDKIDILMKDRHIEDISCNGPDSYLYVYHRIYGSIRTDVMYEEVELNNFVLRLAQLAGRHISILQPIRDVSLPDGSRANLTLGTEVTKKGSTFSIRKFRANPISPIELIEYGTIDSTQLAYLWLLLEYKRSILASGGTATGKTTVLNVLCSFIRPEYKIVSIEDTAELNLMHQNWIQSVTRVGFGMESGISSLSGVSGISHRTQGDISLYDLLVAALRQRPDYIIAGEVRGEEAFTMFQAIAVGHSCMGTIHAGSMRELLARIESNPMNVPRSLFSNVDAVIFNALIKKGEHDVRRVVNIVEILELDFEKGDLITNQVFRWDAGSDTFRYTGRSFLFDKLRDEFGVSEEYLTKELKDRANLLDWMQENRISDYKAVAEIIRAYSRDKEALEERVGENEIQLH
ncbi:hypothetical protein C5S32_03115 [ANME-1 cluster archaeon GoMg1]|nr:hypothetical protein [ANME-1 cluster archaeon GoMg1]